MKNYDQIKAALEGSQFFLEYMPTISLCTDHCVGAEALIRWRSGDELVSPMEFIPVMENTPLSGLVTYWVIEQVSRDLGDWLKTNDNIHIGINTPPELIGRGGLEYAASKSGLLEVADKLLLEVTERGFPDKLALDTLGSISGRIKVAIDDFGTGDANLMQISQMQADIIKIDKFFIDQITDAQEIPKIVKGLVAYAKAMDFTIIAEGVETERQASVLQELDVDMAQGWYFSRPLITEDFIQFHLQTLQQ